jgi:hypothetical protein
MLPHITNLIYYHYYYYFIYAIILNVERERLGFGHMEVHICVHVPLRHVASNNPHVIVDIKCNNDTWHTGKLNEMFY